MGTEVCTLVRGAVDEWSIDYGVPAAWCAYILVLPLG